MLIAFLLLVVIFKFQSDKLNKRQSAAALNHVISGVIVWNIYSFFVVELLSELSVLTGYWLMLAWGVADIVLIIIVGGSLIRNKDLRGRWKGNLAVIGKALWRHKLFSLIGIIVLLLSAFSVPYTPDSLAYHLPRLAHWAQNQSVAHFATNDVRQLSSPVLAEFVNVQVYLLSGNRDNLLNLLQAFSYLLNAWLVYGIAAKIGCNKKFASLAALLFMTMPIAFGEALTTQVDLFAAVWLLIFVYYYIDLYETEKLVQEKDTLTACISMGFCVSFGYLTKPSVNIGMAVLLLPLLLKCVKRKDRPFELMKLVICTLPAVVLPLVPELLRNYHTFAAFSDPSTGKRQLVGTLLPNYFLINLLKNFAQNWPNIYLYDGHEWMARIVVLASEILKVDINDVRIAEDGMAYVMQEAPVYNHDMALNPTVVILATMGFVFCLTRIRKNKSIGNSYSLWAMILFIVFCGAVRWESFVTRYMLSYLAVLCPMIGFQVQTFTEQGQKRQALIPIIYFVCAVELFSLCRYHQEMWHENASVRPEHFFSRNKGSREEYLKTLSWVRENGYKKIGVKLGSSNYEYVIWYMLKDPELQIEHVLVENASEKYGNAAYIPECIVGSPGLGDDNNQILVNEVSYQKAEQFADNEYLTVYLP